MDPQLSDFFISIDTFIIHDSSFLIAYYEWNLRRVKALEFAIFGHILFPKSYTDVDIGLLELRNQIE